VVGKTVHTNIKLIAYGQTYIIYFFGDFSITLFSFLNLVLQVRRAASIDLRQACKCRFAE
jgi:hypothetical protein